MNDFWFLRLVEKNKENGKESKWIGKDVCIVCCTPSGEYGYHFTQPFLPFLKIIPVLFMPNWSTRVPPFCSVSFNFMFAFRFLVFWFFGLLFRFSHPIIASMKRYSMQTRKTLGLHRLLTSNILMNAVLCRKPNTLSTLTQNLLGSMKGKSVQER